MVQRNRLKGEGYRPVMDGQEVATHEASHDALPLRLSDVDIKPQVVDVHPLIPEIRQDLIFQWKLLRTDWISSLPSQLVQRYWPSSWVH